MSMDEVNHSLGIVTNKDEIRRWIRIEREGIRSSERVFDDLFVDWRCNLRLGNEIYISTDEVPKKLCKGEFSVIRPGEFVLFLTKEKLEMPDNVMGFISIRYDYKKKGLVNVSGFHVDPNYEGKLIFSAYNAGPKDIVLRESDPVFMIFFQRLEIHCQKPHRGYTHIPAEMVEQIRGKSATLASNAHRLERLEFYFKILGGIVVALLMAIITVSVKGFLNR